MTSSFFHKYSFCEILFLSNILQTTQVTSHCQKSSYQPIFHISPSDFCCLVAGSKAIKHSWLFAQVIWNFLSTTTKWPKRRPAPAGTKVHFYKTKSSTKFSVKFPFFFTLNYILCAKILLRPKIIVCTTEKLYFDNRANNFSSAHKSDLLPLKV